MSREKENRTSKGAQAAPSMKLVKKGKGAAPKNSPKDAVDRARENILSLQSREGWWVFDLEADVTIPSEYVMLQRFLGKEMDPGLAERLKNYILSKQLPDGGWPLYDIDGAANISATVKAYFALKILGESKDAPHMARARTLVLALGGAETANVFTRIALALMGQVGWHVPPAMPIEIMLLPKWFFFHLSKVSYWSRSVIVPLLILYAKKPAARLRLEESIPELFITPPDKLGNLDSFYTDYFTTKKWRKNFFLLVDRLLKRWMGLLPKSTHKRALRLAEEWTRDHMQGAGGIGGIYPAMANAVMALNVLGNPEDDPDYKRGCQAIEDLLVNRFATQAGEDGPAVTVGKGAQALPRPEQTPDAGVAEAGDTSTFQPCLSPIWDTCLALTAITEAGAKPSGQPVQRAVDWLFAKQVFSKGDWCDKAPGLEPGAWAFQFENAKYPDVDDTASVVMALIRAGVLEDPEHRERIAAAANWVIGMQCSNGGWAAFDIDNNALYLNDIPFADHGALLDPPTSDLTGRALEMMGMMGFRVGFRPIDRGIAFLKAEQEECGAWFGRWGVNYLYGTWSVLAGLAQAGEDMTTSYVRRAAAWVKSVQNPDGGWGETCYSYDDPNLAGRGASTASQTSWALLSLMYAGEVNSPEVGRGVNWLLERQEKNGGWKELHFTGTGFPRVFYLRYHGYSQYFPLWALSVYRRMRAGKPSLQEEISLSSPEGFSMPVLSRLR